MPVIDIFNTDKRYDLVYIDPPWEQGRGGYRKCRPCSSGKALDYPIMTLEEIKRFHSKVLPQITKEKHNIFMWVIDKYLVQAENFMEEIGYTRHARIVWNKLTGMAPAYTVRFTCEYLLWFYIKGNMLMPLAETRGKYSTYLEEPPQRHSQKPECAYLMLEDMFRQAGKIELFARKQRQGWDSWGNEVVQDGS
ncbi:MAG: MT-A70 family methyltransferase [Lachnospiraceae bacterium]|nr:MT-A70 family methyltransferase [Lachnospiraceae bacterium]